MIDDLWIPFSESFPDDDAIIDVWQSWCDPENGKIHGRRLANCWVADGKIVHGVHPSIVRGCTHWMPVPEGPNSET